MLWLVRCKADTQRLSVEDEPVYDTHQSIHMHSHAVGHMPTPTHAHSAIYTVSLLLLTGYTCSQRGTTLAMCCHTAYVSHFVGTTLWLVMCCKTYDDGSNSCSTLMALFMFCITGQVKSNGSSWWQAVTEEQVSAGTRLLLIIHSGAFHNVQLYKLRLKA